MHSPEKNPEWSNLVMEEYVLFIPTPPLIEFKHDLGRLGSVLWNKYRNTAFQELLLYSLD